MKNVGVQWIDPIPNHWEVRKIGQMYKERRTKVSDIDYSPLSVTMKGIVPQLATAAKTDAHDDRKLVKKGDFAINSRSDRRGSCGIARQDGSVSLINTVLCPKKETNPEYLNWLFHTSLFADEFYRWGHGIVDDLWTTNWSDMKRIIIPFPPLPEQSRIATFLDERCGKIDEAIARHKALIEKLDEYRKAVITKAVTKGVRGERKMKESGIEWMGTIPLTWSCSKIKHECELHGRIGWNGLRSNEFEAVSYSYLVTGQDFNGPEIVWEKCFQINKERYDEDSFIQIHNGELLVTKDGTIGKVAIVSNLDKPACLNSGIFVVRQKRKSFVPKYLYWQLASPLLKSFNDYSNLGGTTIVHLYQKTFEQMPLFIPPQEEQAEIVAFLDKKCAAIDAAKDRHQQLITKLEEYKKSLIYNAVTGKIEC